jgi:formylglycine-generating enzyme required for sulfatase activity
VPRARVSAGLTVGVGTLNSASKFRVLAGKLLVMLVGRIFLGVWGVAMLACGCRMPGGVGGLQGRGVPEGMVRVPSGVCERGDWSGEGYADERPVAGLRVQGFYMDRFEVSWGLWMEVYEWALGQGYEFGEVYPFHPGRELSHPVCFVSWHDAVKWCNARSEMEGREPVYMGDEDWTEVYRAGLLDLAEGMVRWGGDGYRLPTELEWEWAARGGLERQHYPWSSGGEDFERFLDGGKANYWGSGDPWETESDCATSPAGYYDGMQEPLGRDMANGYGLYDMSGNVNEWCWDWYLDTWYGEAVEVLEENLRGPERGYGRVLRGGSWISSPKYVRVSARYMSGPEYRCHCYGFRCVVAEGQGGLGQ